MDTSYFVREDRKTYKKTSNEKYLVININKNGIHFLEELKKTLKQYDNQGYTYYFVPVANGGNDTSDPKILQERMIPASLRNTENDLTYLPELQKEFPQIKIASWTDDLEKFLQFL